MSLVSHIVNDLLEDISNPLAHLYDQHFGLGLCDDDVLYRAPSLLSLIPRRPLSSALRNRANSSVAVNKNSRKNKANEFEVHLDVQQFKPEEIDVKVVDDFLVVEAKHEERQDKHGFISRQFTRRYKLPENINLDAMKSTISSDGVLLISAPLKFENTSNKVREIPIVQTNQPALKHTKATEKVEKPMMSMAMKRNE